MQGHVPTWSEVEAMLDPVPTLSPVEDAGSPRWAEHKSLPGQPHYRTPSSSTSPHQMTLGCDVMRVYRYLRPLGPSSSSPGDDAKSSENSPAAGPAGAAPGIKFAATGLHTVSDF